MGPKQQQQQQQMPGGQEPPRTLADLRERLRQRGIRFTPEHLQTLVKLYENRRLTAPRPQPTSEGGKVAHGVAQGLGEILRFARDMVELQKEGAQPKGPATPTAPAPAPAGPKVTQAAEETDEGEGSDTPTSDVPSPDSDGGPADLTRRLIGDILV